MKSVLLLIHSLQNGLLTGLLIFSFSNFQPPLQAAAESDTFKVIEDIEEGGSKRLTLECQHLPTSVSQSSSSLVPSKSTLRRIRLEQTLRFGDTVYMFGVDSLSNTTALWLLGDENTESIYGKRSQYIQCGQPIQLIPLQNQLKQLRRVFSGVLPGEKADDFGVMSFFDVISRIENNDTLVLSIEPRRIHDIKIATWCDWNQWAAARRGTVSINGQKPDALIHRILGIVPGDKLPSHATVDTALDNLWSSGLFRSVSFGLGIEDDPDKLSWIVCMKQKSEAELAYDAAQTVSLQNSPEAIKQAINQYKATLPLFKQPLTAPREYNRPPDQEMKKYRFMSFSNARVKASFPTEADTLIRIAANYTILNEFYQALHYYSQALESMQLADDKNAEFTTILIEMGDIYTTLGNQQQAYHYYQQALSILLKNQRQQQR
ncbi:MAG: tetratricopeptide repeat protein [Phormidium tanganyikae FI6-MK23]|jgi:hypothetical protein|nr:tetratricopeptide repeat protein [Phormidium tanganyikae FI6-MK23]